jgi:hypothetical protein
MDDNITTISVDPICHQWTPPVILSLLFFFFLFYMNLIFFFNSRSMASRADGALGLPLPAVGGRALPAAARGAPPTAARGLCRHPRASSRRLDTRSYPGELDVACPVARCAGLLGELRHCRASPNVCCVTALGEHVMAARILRRGRRETEGNGREKGEKKQEQSGSVPQILRDGANAHIERLCS